MAIADGTLFEPALSYTPVQKPMRRAGQNIRIGWGRSCGDGGEQVEIDEEDVAPLAGLVMEHYNCVIIDLDAGGYGAVYGDDVATGELVWQTWVEGFMRAMSLAPDSWMAYLDSPDEDISSAVSMLVGLVGVVMAENQQAWVT